MSDLSILHPQMREELPSSMPWGWTEQDSAGLAQHYCTWDEMTPPNTQRCNPKCAVAAPGPSRRWQWAPTLRSRAGEGARSWRGEAQRGAGGTVGTPLRGHPPPWASPRALGLAPGAWGPPGVHGGGCVAPGGGEPVLPRGVWGCTAQAVHPTAAPPFTPKPHHHPHTPSSPPTPPLPTSPAEPRRRSGAPGRPQPPPPPPLFWAGPTGAGSAAPADAVSEGFFLTFFFFFFF